MRAFLLYRHEDETGISGTGVVAEGVEFTDGRVALRWCVPDSPAFTNSGDSVADVRRIHGHGGRTEVVWVQLDRHGMAWWATSASRWWSAPWRWVVARLTRR